MKDFHPDDSGMVLADAKDKDGKNRNRPRGLLAEFMPGDKRALIDQMMFGFGGNPQAYRRQLNRLYSPMPINFKYGKGSGFGMDAINPTGTAEPNLPYFYTGSPIFPYRGGK